MSEIKDQPDPIRTGGRPIWELVIEDMKERDNIGHARYGTRLQAFNGRDSLVDAYQECLDMAVYLRQLIEELTRPTQVYGSTRPSPQQELEVYKERIQSLCDFMDEVSNGSGHDTGDLIRAVERVTAGFTPTEYEGDEDEEDDGYDDIDERNDD